MRPLWKLSRLAMLERASFPLPMGRLPLVVFTRLSACAWEAHGLDVAIRNGYFGPASRSSADGGLDEGFHQFQVVLHREFLYGPQLRKMPSTM